MSDETELSGSEPAEDTPTSQKADPRDTTGQGTSKGETESDGKPEEDESSAFDESLLLEKEEIPTPQPKKESPRKVEAAKALETWTDRLATGNDNPKTEKPYTLEDVPEWLRPRVEENLQRLGGIEIEKAPALSEDEILDKLELRQLIKSIPEMPKAKQTQLVSFVKGYESKGMNQLNAFREAISRMSEQDSEFKRGLNRGLRAAPPEGEPVMKQKRDKKLTESAQAAGRQMGITDEDREREKKHKQNELI